MEGSKMIVDNLDSMEKIVNKNKNLFWDGWSVVHKERTEKGRSSKFGQLVNGKWHIVKRYEPSRSGWEIPESFGNA